MGPEQLLVESWIVREKGLVVVTIFLVKLETKRWDRAYNVYQVPVREATQERPWELCQWVEELIIGAFANGIEEQSHCKDV